MGKQATIMILVDSDTRDQFKRACIDQHVTMSQALRAAIEAVITGKSKATRKQ